MDPRVKPGGDRMSIFRFAPSPNGYLHLGHALSALLNAERAKAAGGRLLLRIEDIDAARCRPEFEAAIYEDLAWFGIAWEQPVRRQSEHYGDYRAALAKLDAMGLVYPSFESRAEIAAQVTERETKAPWPRDPDGVPLSPGNAKTMARAERARRMAAEPYALRLDMTAALVRSGPLTWEETGAGPSGETGSIAADPAANPAHWGDVILARKETPTSYHLAVAVDDTAQGGHRIAGAARARRQRGGPTEARRARLKAPAMPLSQPGWETNGEAQAQQAAAPTAAQSARAPAQGSDIGAGPAHGRSRARRHRARHPHPADRDRGAGRAAGDLRHRRARARMGDRHQERRRSSRRAHHADRRCRQGRCRRPHFAARAVLAAAAGRGGRRRADRARRQQRHQGRHRVRARSAGDGGRRRAAAARGTGKPGRQCGQIYQ